MKKNYINVFRIHQNIYDECAIWCDKRDSAENGTKKKFHFYSHIMWNANAYMWTHLYVFKCNMLDIISFFFSLSRIFVWLTSIQSQPSQFDKPTRESLLFETKQKKIWKEKCFLCIPSRYKSSFLFLPTTNTAIRHTQLHIPHKSKTKHTEIYVYIPIFVLIFSFVFRYDFWKRSKKKLIRRTEFSTQFKPKMWASNFQLSLFPFFFHFILHWYIIIFFDKRSVCVFVKH